ncbi:MAG: ABC transporter permease [Anaerolineales bacterium]|jgi:oligopeptide transport system permease protein
MQRYILRRILFSIPVLFTVVLFSFLLIRLQPNGPFAATPAGFPMPETLRTTLETRYGLNQPWYQQFVQYVSNLLQGNFGPMLRSRFLDVNEVIAASLPVTLQLGFLALALGMAIGVPAGVTAAIYHNSRVDYLATLLAVLGISIPNLVLAPLLVWLFGIELDWLPIAFWGAEQPFFLGFLPTPSLEFWLHAILPTVTLAVVISASVARLLRASLLEVLSKDYIRTARAKGLKEQAVLFRHALKNAFIPTLTVLGPILVTLLPGTIVVENIFALNGLGRQLVESVFDREYFLMTSSMLIFAILLVMGNLITDVLYAYLDPRISYKGQSQ